MIGLRGAAWLLVVLVFGVAACGGSARPEAGPEDDEPLPPLFQDADAASRPPAAAPAASPGGSGSGFGRAPAPSGGTAATAGTAAALDNSWACRQARGELWKDHGDLSRLECGLYFFRSARDGKMISVRSPKAEDKRYFDPNRETIIYIHGWQSDVSPGWTARNWRESFLVPPRPGAAATDIASGLYGRYNVGIFYWNQFADEPAPWNAEEKIYRRGERLTYRVRTGTDQSRSETLWGPPTSVVELFYSSYASALWTTKKPVRLVAHSLGAGLALQFAYHVSELERTGKLRESPAGPRLVPARVTLVDPYWSTIPRPYLDGRATGQAAYDVVVTLKNRYSRTGSQGTFLICPTPCPAFDWYQFSEYNIGQLFGDDNERLRREVVYTRMFPDFLGPGTGFSDARYQRESFAHTSYSRYWYFRSIGTGMTRCEKSWWLGACEPIAMTAPSGRWSNSDLRDVMDAMAAAYWWEQYGGKDTPTTSDDTALANRR